MKKSYKGKRIIAFLLAMLLLVQMGDEYTSVSLAQNKSSNIEEPIAEPITKSETEEAIESEQATETVTEPVAETITEPQIDKVKNPVSESDDTEDFRMPVFNMFSDDEEENSTGEDSEEAVLSPIEYEAAAASTGNLVSIQGTVRYQNDNDWKSLIRPGTFSEEILITALDADGNGIQTFETNTEPGKEFYLEFVHDGNGGGTYKIGNMPTVISIDGEDKTVKDYKVSIPEKGGYKAAEQTALNISEGETSFVGVDLVREPITAKIQITKQLLGAEEESGISFEMKVSAKAGEKTAEKKVTVVAGGNVSVTVPADFTYTLEETAKEGYLFLYYLVGDTKSGSCSIQAEKDENYAVTVVNACNNHKEEWQVNWIDNHGFSGRPTPKFKLQFRLDGDTDYTTVTEENYTEIGLTQVPEAKKTATDLEQRDIEKYCFENLPTVTTDGKSITYRVVTDDTDSAQQEYLIEWNANRSAVTYTAATTFSATMKWSDASDQSLRSSMDTVKPLLNLYCYTGTKYEKVTLQENELVLTENTDKVSWAISINKMLPKYTSENESLTYVLVQGTITEDGTVQQSLLNGYQTNYLNGQGSFGNVIDKCYNGQNIVQTLVGTIHFTATKTWKDEGEDKRPPVIVTLWRYSMKDSADTEIDMSRSARVIVSDKSGNDILMSYQLQTSGTVSNGTNSNEAIDFLEHFQSRLTDGYAFPKYDELGREYHYFVQEIVIDEDDCCQYTTAYLNIGTEENGGIVKTETGNGVFDGGEIVNTKIDKLAVKVNKKWSAPSALKDLEGKEITFALIGENSEGVIEEIPILGGGTKVSGFSADQTFATTEFLVNPYDKQGKPYTILGIQEKQIKGIEEGSLSYIGGDLTKATFSIGENLYLGTCEDKTVVGSVSQQYGVNQVTYQVTNTIMRYKDYTIEKRWETGNGVITQDLTFKLKAKSLAPSAIQKEYEVIFTKDDEHTVTINIDGQVKSFTYSETVNGDWTIWNVCFTGLLPMFDEEGYLIEYWAEEIIPANKSWTHTTYSYTDDKTTVSNYVTEDGSYRIYVEKNWKDDGDADHRQPVEIHVFDKNGNDLSSDDETYPYKIVLSKDNFWRGYISVENDPKTEGYTVREVKVGTTVVPKGDDKDNPYSFVEIKGLCSYNIAYEATNNNRNFKITNTRSGEIDIEIIKNWEDGNNAAGKRPDSLNFLIKKGENDDSPMTVTLTEGNNLVNDDVNQWKKAGITLSKYDGDGNLISYLIEEENQTIVTSDGKDKYQKISDHTDYTYDENGKSVISYTCTNRLEGSTDFTVYKRWNDKATQGKTRPDIYLTLHQIDTQTNFDILYIDYKNQTWEAGNGASDNYNWKISIEKLPAYNEEGYPYKYYVVEAMNDNGASTGMPYKASYCKAKADGSPDTENPNVDGEGNPEEKAYDGDYIVNMLSDIMTVEGEKIWKNTQGFTVDELPEPHIYLYRHLASESEPIDVNTNDAIAELVLDGKAPAADAKNYGNTSKTAFIFTTDKAGNSLPKYSPEGERYIYFLREEIPLKENVSLYKKENKNNSIVNTFDLEKNKRSISVTKLWARGEVPSESNEQEYPAVTLNLYRYKKPEGGNTLTKEEKKSNDVLKSITINASEFKAAANGEVTAVFEDLLIYSPNGTRYYYYIEEEYINGYSTSYYTTADGTGTASTEGIDIIDEMTLDSVVKSTSVSVKNSYDRYENIKLNGKKYWNDYGDYFAYRPTGITVELFRYTVNQQGQENKVNEVKVALRTDVSEGDTSVTDPYIIWIKDNASNVWTYTVYNLRHYGPNGEAYIYKLVEKQDADQYYGNGDTTVNQGGQDGGSGNITMKDFTNQFSASCYVRKNWIDGDNKYGFRPQNITVVLQRSTDGVTWENMPNPSYSVGGTEPEYMQAVLTSANAIPNTKDNSWEYTFKNLPKYEKDTRKEYQYRCVETKLGDIAFTSEVGEENLGSYTRTYSSWANNKTVIANSMSTTGLCVTKLWDDAENLYQTRPDKLQFWLQKTNVTNPGEGDWTNAKDTSGNDIILTMTAEDSTDKSTWVKTFDSLPVGENGTAHLYYRAVEITETQSGEKYPKVGTDIYKNYLVTEDGSTVGDSSVWQYNMSASRNESTVKNKMVISQTINKITVEKKWCNDSGSVPADVVFELQKKEGSGAYKSFNPKVTKQIKKGASDKTVSFENLPGVSKDGENMEYRIIEVTSVDGYQSILSDRTVEGTEAKYICTNIQLMDFTVSKIWNGNQNGLLPEGKTDFVSEGILQKKTGGEGEWCLATDAASNPYTFSLNGNEDYKFENLPRYAKDGERIYYRGIETKVNGIPVDENKSYTIDYSHSDTASQITNTLVTVPIQITKVWKDKGNPDRPDDILLTLYADYDGTGSREKEVVPDTKYSISWDKTTDSNNWKATITGLPSYAADGKTEILYSLEETVDDHYFAKTDTGRGDAAQWQFTITNTQELTVTLKKLDPVNGGPLEGTEFMLYQAEYDSVAGKYMPKSGTDGKSYITDAEGNIRIPIKATGFYILEEKKASAYYELGSEPFNCYFEVTDGDFCKTIAFTSETAAKKGNVTSEGTEPFFVLQAGNDKLLRKDGLANERKKGTLKIYKTDGDSGANLEGVTFTLYRKKEGNIFENAWNFITANTYEAFGEIKESGTGVTVIENLEWGDYKLVETATLDGYKLTSDEYFFTMKAENADSPVELTSVVNAELAGQGSEKSIIIRNYRNKLQFLKQSTNAVSLSGGTYRIVKVTEESREEVSFDTDATGAGGKKNQLTAGEAIYGLPVGNYEIEELAAPAGYRRSMVPVAFTVDEAGVIYKDKEKKVKWQDNQVIMQDEPMRLAIRKIDADNNLPLTGAEFSVTGIFASGGVQESASSTISGLTTDNFEELLRGRLIASTGDSEGIDLFSYQLQETKAPEGYGLLQETVTFKLSETGDVELTQAPSQVSLNREAEVSEIVLKNKINRCSFVVTKIFEKDDDWKESIRPQKVSLQLYVQIEGTDAKQKVGEPVTLEITKERDSYTYTFEKLPTHYYFGENGGISKKLLYSVEETAVEPANLGVYYRTEYGTVTESGATCSQTIVNSADELLPAGFLKISKTNSGGPRDAVFKMRVTFAKDGEETVFKDTYQVYEADTDNDDSNDKLLRADVKASEGYVEIKGGEYAKLTLPKNVQYHIEEELVQIGETVQYLPDYTAQDGTIIANKTVQASILNRANIYTAIENDTENAGNSYPEGQKPKNAGGIVGIATGNVSDGEDYDMVDYQEGKLSVYWMPDEYWEYSDCFTVVYREFDGSAKGGTEQEIIVTGFLNEDGTVKDVSDSCYDKLRERYPDMEISQNEDGAIILRLADTVKGMPYLNKVNVEFLPTVAVLNTTPKNAGGQVKVENGQFSEVADGKGVQGEKRYAQIKVYAKAEKDYIVDLSDIVIGNVDTIDMPVNAANLLDDTQESSGKSKLILDEDNRFCIRLPYRMAGKDDDYTIQGRVEVLETDKKGRPTDIALILEDLTMPIDIGISFVKKKTTESDADQNVADEDITDDTDSSESNPSIYGAVDNNSGGSRNSASDFPVSGLGKKDAVPKTGENDNMDLYVMLMLIGGLGMVLSKRRNRLRRKEG